MLHRHMTEDVQTFLSQVNWDNSIHLPSALPLGWMTVRTFFAKFCWDGDPAILVSRSLAAITAHSSDQLHDLGKEDPLTLSDLFSLF
jgi:hypothetical protein